MLKKLKSMLIFISKEKATIGIKISKLFFKAKVRLCRMADVFLQATWELQHLATLARDVTASYQAGRNTSAAGTLQQDPKRILSMFNVHGCTRCFLRLLFARPCQCAAKLLGSGSEGRKQNSFSISNVLTSKEAVRSVEC